MFINHPLAVTGFMFKKETVSDNYGIYNNDNFDIDETIDEEDDSESGFTEKEIPLTDFENE